VPKFHLIILAKFLIVVMSHRRYTFMKTKAMSEFQPIKNFSRRLNSLLTIKMSQTPPTFIPLEVTISSDLKRCNQ